MKVAVIGAGPSGLVAVKELRAEGHDVECFERAADIGGVFRFDQNSNGVWESCRLTSSTLITTFSDFPPSPDASLQFSHAEYLQYLRDYCDHFELTASLRFRHLVERVRRQRDGTWIVTVRHGTQQRTQVFDAVAVCSGLHQIPNIPDLPNRRLFGGEVLHAATYKNAAPFAGKRVVVVGVGESGAEIAAEIAAVACACALSVRRLPFVFRRLIAGNPNDYYTTRLRYSLPEWVERVENPRDSVRRRRAVLGLLTTPFRLAVHLGNWIEKRVTRLRSEPTKAEAVKAKVLEVVEEFRTKSGGGFAEQFATKSEAFIYSIVEGSCEMRPAIADLTPDGVRFTDGSSFEADSILLCTGYRSSFEFLDIDLSDARTLFKSCFDPDTGPTLALMGQVRPSVGAIPPIAEMQARWFALLCSGRRRLPSVESMRHEANRDGREHRERFPCHSDRLPYLVDFTSYMDDLAARVGCKPRFRELLGRPRLAYAVYTGPFSAHQYRLRGPHAEPSVVEPVFERFPQAQALRRVLLQIVSLMVCKLLAGVGFGSYRSHLSLASPNAGGEALPPPQSS